MSRNFLAWPEIENALGQPCGRVNGPPLAALPTTTITITTTTILAACHCPDSLDSAKIRRFIVLNLISISTVATTLRSPQNHHNGRHPHPSPRQSRHGTYPRHSHPPFHVNSPQLLNQMNASLKYIKNRAPPGIIPGQPHLSSFAEIEAQAATQNPSQPAAQADTQPPPPPTQEEYQNDIRELSRDMILKEQQIEVLVASLPGLNTSENEQMERMKELERELEGLEGERIEAVREREDLLKRVEEKIGSVGGMR